MLLLKISVFLIFFGSTIARLLAHRSADGEGQNRGQNAISFSRTVTKGQEPF